MFRTSTFREDYFYRLVHTKMAIAQKTLHDHEEKTRIKEEERKKIIADLSHSIKNLISTAALKHSVGNMFDGKYFGTFMRKYIPEKSLYLAAKSEWSSLGTRRQEKLHPIHLVTSCRVYVLVHKSRIPRNLGAEGRSFLQNLRSNMI